jgi:hypothetical protein
MLDRISRRLNLPFGQKQDRDRVRIERLFEKAAAGSSHQRIALCRALYTSDLLIPVYPERLTPDAPDAKEHPPLEALRHLKGLGGRPIFVVFLNEDAIGGSRPVNSHLPLSGARLFWMLAQYDAEQVVLMGAGTKRVALAREEIQHIAREARALDDTGH